MLYNRFMKSVTRRGHKKASTASGVIANRRAGYDYVLSDRIMAGLSLTGAEVKAARDGRVSLRGAYVTPHRGKRPDQPELYLINATFTLRNNVPRGSGQPSSTIDTRARKLLLHRKQIDRLIDARNSGMTIVPTKLLTSGKYIKIEIAVGKGKKLYDKRRAIKERDYQREARHCR